MCKGSQHRVLPCTSQILGHLSQAHGKQCQSHPGRGWTAGEVESGTTIRWWLCWVIKDAGAMVATNGTEVGQWGGTACKGGNEVPSVCLCWLGKLPPS
eukprot:CCRYP_010535-RB/>CCRYP_010535-RB protein AED:0.45 eAED:1.00 QI:0/-1/0/1/-1/0/1/0/97